MQRDKEKIDHYTLTRKQIALGTQTAEANRLKSTDLAEVLDRYRLGDGTAAKRLREAFEFLGWQERDKAARNPKTRDDADNVLTQAVLDIATCIERLLTNDVCPEDVQRYVAAEVVHSAAHLQASNDDTIKPKAHGSTLPPVKRTRAFTTSKWHPDADPYSPELIDPREDPKAALPSLTGDGSDYRIPSRFEQQTPQDEMIAAEDAEASQRDRREEYLRLLPYARNEADRAILRAHLEQNVTPEDYAMLSCIARKFLDGKFAEIVRRAA